MSAAYGGDPAPHRTVADVMTREVVTVVPETGFKEVARLLTEHRFSALPVVDAAGRPLGVVSAADLLPKERRLQKPLLGGRRWKVEHDRAEARTVRHLMTSPAVSIRGDATLQEASRLMYHHGLRRLCIIDEDGRLAGIVTRGELLGAFVRPDEEICDEIRRDVMARVMGMDPTVVRLEVEDGIVRLSGEVERHSEAEILVRLASRVDGVVSVDDGLTWRFDDQAAALTAAPLF